MKYLLNITKYVAVLAAGILLLNSCDKVKTPTPMGDAGQTLVKIIGGGTPAAISKKPVDFVSTPTTVVAADIRRDVANNTELNRKMIVTVIDDTAAVTATDPGYIHLSKSWYKLQIGDNPTMMTPVAGQTLTLTFEAGEFAKPIYITIPDATILDPSALYAVGFTIMTADASGKLADARSVVVEIGAKNDWDGVYEMNGTFSDVTNAGFTHYGAQQYSLVTASGTECSVINDDLNGGIPGYIFTNAGSGTYYGSYGLVIGFNPATNAIATLHNYYGDPSKTATGGGNPALGTGPPVYASSNNRRAVLDPSGVNAVQGNKDIVIKHWMVQPSVVPSGPRALFNETWVYLGPR